MTRLTPRRTVAWACSGLFVTLVAGCGAPIDVDQISMPEEPQAGSGLISGEQGAFVFGTGAGNADVASEEENAGDAPAEGEDAS